MAAQKKKDDQPTKEKKPLGRLSYKLDYEFDKNIVCVKYMFQYEFECDCL